MQTPTLYKTASLNHVRTAQQGTRMPMRTSSRTMRSIESIDFEIGQDVDLNLDFSQDINLDGLFDIDQL